jgi:hypothetical protein
MGILFSSLCISQHEYKWEYIHRTRFVHATTSIQTHCNNPIRLGAECYVSSTRRKTHGKRWHPVRHYCSFSIHRDNSGIYEAYTNRRNVSVFIPPLQASTRSPTWVCESSVVVIRVQGNYSEYLFTYISQSIWGHLQKFHSLTVCHVQ